MFDIKRLDSTDNDFWPALKNLLAWDNVSDDSVQTTVRQILKDIEQFGDAKLIEKFFLFFLQRCFLSAIR